MRRHEKETVMHPDANGVLQEYSRDVSTLEAIAKQKIVVAIDIHITDIIEKKYWCCNIGDDFPTLVSECDMGLTEKSQALEFAQQRLEDTQESYYGSAL